MAVATAILNGNFLVLTETEELAIIRHRTGAPLYWEAFSTCVLVLLSSVAKIFDISQIDKEMRKARIR